MVEKHNPIITHDALDRHEHVRLNFLFQGLVTCYKVSKNQFNLDSEVSDDFWTDLHQLAEQKLEDYIDKSCYRVIKTSTRKDILHLDPVLIRVSSPIFKDFFWEFPDHMRPVSRAEATFKAYCRKSEVRKLIRPVSSFERHAEVPLDVALSLEGNEQYMDHYMRSYL